MRENENDPTSVKDNLSSMRHRTKYKLQFFAQNKPNPNKNLDVFSPKDATCKYINSTAQRDSMAPSEYSPFPEDSLVFPNKNEMPVRRRQTLTRNFSRVYNGKGTGLRFK